MINRLLLILILTALSMQLKGQQEFVKGRSANALAQNEAIISLAFGSPILEGQIVQRWELDMSYAVTNKLTLSLSGSAANFNTSPFRFETGNVAAQYQLSKSGDLKRSLAVFGEVSIISEVLGLTGDINFDGNNSGLSLGLVSNWTLNKTTLALTGAYAKVNTPKVVAGLLPGYALLYQVSSNTLLNERGSPFEIAFIGELIGQYNTDIGEEPAFVSFGRPSQEEGSYLDMLIGLQGTIDNQWRMEMAFQTPIYSDVARIFEFTDLFQLKLKYFIK